MRVPGRASACRARRLSARPSPACCARAAQDDVDARHQLARAERLGDIVVAAHLEPEQRSISSSRADRNRIGTSDVLPDPPADLQPVHLRHADIEHDEVAGLAASKRCSAAAPSATACVSMPAFSSAKQMTSRICGSSSATRIWCGMRFEQAWREWIGSRSESLNVILLVEIAKQAPVAKATTRASSPGWGDTESSAPARE